MSFASLLQAFQNRRALVVGDLMLDEYIFGRATRISPEAPVIVVKQERQTAVPGGAANVARNLVALGAKVSVVGVVGDDDPGQRLAASLRTFAEATLITDSDRPTTRKTRVLANHAHQVVRIDHEDERPAPAEIEARLLHAAKDRIKESDVLLISDYSKGGVTTSLIEALIAEARSAGVPVVANPKPRSVPHYRGAALVSLNRAESAAALGQASLESTEALSAARSLRESLGVGALLITLGGDGMAAAWPEGAAQVPAVRVEVYDEAGAGDTVIATVALGVAADALDQTLLTLAAQTAAAVVRKVGVAAPDAADLAAIAQI